MHHSPKTTSRSTSPHLQHRVQSLNILDDTTIGGLGFSTTGTASAAGQFSTLYPSNISTVNQQTSTTSSLVDAQHHSQYQQTGGSLLDHPLTPTKFRQQKTSTSVQTNGYDGPSTSQFGRLHQQHQQQLPIGSISASTSTLHHVHTHSVGAGGGVGFGAASTSTHHLYRQQSASSAQFSPVPAPLHPHQQHQSTTTCDLLGHSNANVIKSTTTVNSVATASTLADSCCSGIHQGAGAGAACQSSEQPPHQYATTGAGGCIGGSGGAQGTAGGALPREILPACQRDGGTHCCLTGEKGGCISEMRHHWHACPELRKAMEGVNYIAEQTRKEEESTRVSTMLYYYKHIYMGASKYKQTCKKNAEVPGLRFS